MIPLEVEGPWSCIDVYRVTIVEGLPRRRKQAVELTGVRGDAEGRGRGLLDRISVMDDSSWEPLPGAKFGSREGEGKQSIWRIANR